MSKLFIGGRSTQPEIDALSAAITPTPGKHVSHEEVARIVGLEVGSVRFQTVTQRWRKMIERDTAVRVESRDRVYHFLTPDEAHDRVRTDVHHIGKRTAKVHVRASAIEVNSLSGERKETHFLLVRETAALLDSVRRSAKAIRGPKPIKPANLRLAQG